MTSRAPAPGTQQQAPASGFRLRLARYTGQACAVGPAARHACRAMPGASPVDLRRQGTPTTGNGCQSEACEEMRVGAEGEHARSGSGGSLTASHPHVEDAPLARVRRSAAGPMRSPGSGDSWPLSGQGVPGFFRRIFRAGGRVRGRGYIQTGTRITARPQAPRPPPPLDRNHRHPADRRPADAAAANPWSADTAGMAAAGLGGRDSRGTANPSQEGRTAKRFRQPPTPGQEDTSLPPGGLGVTYGRRAAGHARPGLSAR